MSGPLDEDDLAREEHEATLAASPMLQCPAVADERSLRTAIRFADRHPGARIFTIKGAFRLGRADLLPTWPEVSETIVHTGRVAAVVTGSGALVDQRTGQPVGAPPPSRRTRRQIRDRADLLARINAAPSDPAERRALVEAAVQLDRLRWVPDGWPEKPVQPVPLRPGAARALAQAARPWQRNPHPRNGGGTA